MLEPDPELAVAYGLFSVRQARAAGYSEADIRRQLRRGTWQRVDRGILSAAGRTPVATDKLVLAALRAGPDAVIGFESAADVCCWDLRSPPRQVHLIRPASATSSAAYRARLEPGDVVLAGVLKLTSPVRTALDIAAARDFETAVITLDSALRSRQVTLRELRDYFDRSRRSHVRRARRALAAADPRSGSVPETEARLLFSSAGLAPETQLEIRSGLRLLACVDFGWEDAKLAVEVDGFAYHSAEGDFQHDRTRQNAVQLDGWLVLRFTVADIRRRPEFVVAQVRRALLARTAA